MHSLCYSLTSPSAWQHQKHRREGTDECLLSPSLVPPKEVPLATGFKGKMSADISVVKRRESESEAI